MSISVDSLKENNIIVIYNSVNDDIISVYGWDDIINYIRSPSSGLTDEEQMRKRFTSEEIEKLEEVFEEEFEDWVIKHNHLLIPAPLPPHSFLLHYG